MLEPLTTIMARLRDPQTGCEWDVAQDFASIAPYTIEEAYETADAITRGDMDALKDELGDLLLQVVFHARMAEEAGHFSIHDVIASICTKMERRHPHIFGDDVSGTDQRERWEDIKQAERSKAGSDSLMDNVALALPALMRAQKLQSRAARVGFDWPDAASCADKVQEELAELAEATDGAHRHEEAGDVLFSAVNMVRKYGIDAETALRDGNAKFERRFRLMEGMAGHDGLNGRSLDDLEDLWKQAKNAT